MHSIESSNWIGDADLVFTAPDGPIPPCLIGKPCILVVHEGKGKLGSKRIEAEQWSQAKLFPICSFDWPKNRQTVYVGRLPAHSIDIKGASGMRTPELSLRILLSYPTLLRAGFTVWDGYMDADNPAIMQACGTLKLHYIGIDHDGYLVDQPADEDTEGSAHRVWGPEW